MRALCDYPIVLPYTAAVPWPYVELQQQRGQQDWIASVDTVESWLEVSIGPHLVTWVWSTWTLHQTGICAVGFLHQRDTTLFLLRFGQ